LDVHVTFSGGYIGQTDTTFNSAVTSFNQGQHIAFPANSGAAGSSRSSAAPPTARITSRKIRSRLPVERAGAERHAGRPTAPAVASSGKNIRSRCTPQQLGGIERIGFIITRAPPSWILRRAHRLAGVHAARAAAADTFYTDTLTVQPGFTSFTVTAFAVDAGGRRALSNTVTVTVQTPGNDVTPPTVSHTISSRVEVNDNIAVHATDPSGIKVMASGGHGARRRSPVHRDHAAQVRARLDHGGGEPDHGR